MKNTREELGDGLVIKDHHVQANTVWYVTVEGLIGIGHAPPGPEPPSFPRSCATPRDGMFP